MSGFTVPAIRIAGDSAMIAGHNGTPFVLDTMRGCDTAEMNVGESLGWA